MERRQPAACAKHSRRRRRKNSAKLHPIRLFLQIERGLHFLAGESGESRRLVFFAAWGYFAAFPPYAEADDEVAMRDVDIANHFIRAAAVALHTMAGIIATPGKFFVKHDKKALGDITAIIGVAGHRVGTIAVSFTRESAAALVHGMLGDDVGDLEQDMRDAVGEITNMISGQARAGIAEAGVILQASTPTLVVGDDIDIEHKTHAPVIVIPFTTPDKTFAVEFCLGEQ